MLFQSLLTEITVITLIITILKGERNDYDGLDLKDTAPTEILSNYRILHPIRQEITQIEVILSRKTTSKNSFKTTSAFLLETKEDYSRNIIRNEELKEEPRNINENIEKGIKPIENKMKEERINIEEKTTKNMQDKNKINITKEQTILMNLNDTTKNDNIISLTMTETFTTETNTIISNRTSTTSSENENDVDEEEIIKIKKELPEAIHLREQYAGGFNCHRKWYPYFAYILRLSGSYCAGSLISPRYILTAGHCCYGHQIKGVFAGYYHERNTWDQYLEPENVIVHGRYDEITFQYDACIIKVEGFEKTSVIKFIDLEPKFNTLNVNLFSVGYATNNSVKSTSFYHLGSMPCIENVFLLEDVCKRRMSESGININRYDPETMICTEPGFKRTHQNFESEAGGPLIMSNQQVGIGSFVLSTKNGTDLSFHTQIDAVFPFINAYLTGNIQERFNKNGCNLLTVQYFVINVIFFITIYVY